MLKKRLNNKKGFTLAELLIAVAIIGILVAISVPVFTGKLSDAKKATDNANIRAAKAAAVAKYLDTETGGTFYYDGDSGVLKADKAGIKAYGKSKAAVDGATEVPVGNILEVKINETSGEVTLKWVATAS